MILNKIILENFISHKKTHLDLDYGINVVIGPNGAGKTAILDAVSFALFCDYSNRGKKENLINTKSKECKIGLIFSESGVVQDEVMDYCYNLLASLDENAIIITNGDNDTYPIWILTRVLRIRPDVIVANRSLLNTDWYPLYLIKQGLPSFIAKRELNDLRKAIISKIKN